jgi:hypothetical protein
LFEAGQRDVGLLETELLEAELLEARLLMAGLLEAGLLEAGHLEAGLLEADLLEAGQWEAGLLEAGQREVGLTFMYLSKPNMLGEGVCDSFTSGVREVAGLHCSALTCSSRSPSARASACPPWSKSASCSCA